MIVTLKSGEIREYVPCGDGKDLIHYRARAGAGGDLEIYSRKMPPADLWRPAPFHEYVIAIFAAGEWVSAE